MKINITKKEYVNLLEVLYVADLIMNGFYSEERAETKMYRDLEQKIFSFAKDFGVNDLVEYDREDEKFYPTEKFEDESPAVEYVKEYEQELFWDELTERLAKRDLVSKYDSEIMKTVFENKEIFAELENLKKNYVREFEMNGIDKLQIV